MTTDLQYSKRISYSCQDFWHENNTCGILRETDIKQQISTRSNNSSVTKTLVFDNFQDFNNYNILWYTLYHPNLICHVNTTRSSYYLRDTEPLCIEQRIYMPKSYISLSDWVVSIDIVREWELIQSIMSKVLSVVEYLHLNNLSCRGYIDLYNLYIVPDTTHVYVLIPEHAVHCDSDDLESEQWKDVWALILLFNRLTSSSPIYSGTNASDILDNVDNVEFWFGEHFDEVPDQFATLMSKFMSLIDLYVNAKADSFECLEHFIDVCGISECMNYEISWTDIDLCYRILSSLVEFYSLHSVTFEKTVLVSDTSRLFRLHEIHDDRRQVFVILQHIWTTLQYCSGIQYELRYLHNVHISQNIRLTYENPFVRLQI